jgi:hypothetical protein
MQLTRSQCLATAGRNFKNEKGPMSVSLTSDLGRRQVKLHSADCSIGIFQPRGNIRKARRAHPVRGKDRSPPDR